MIRIVMLASAFACCSGCFSWQETYDSAARSDCRDIVNPEERQDCLTHVERNSAERRADRRT
ncbi:MAG: hypothetical protein R3C46_08840 [Hyphomonadaceae bacterium]